MQGNYSLDVQTAFPNKLCASDISSGCFASDFFVASDNALAFS